MAKQTKEKYGKTGLPLSMPNASQPMSDMMKWVGHGKKPIKPNAKSLKPKPRVKPRKFDPKKLEKVAQKRIFG